MAISAPSTIATVTQTAGATSATLDITTGTTGNWQYAFVGWAFATTAISGITHTGWTTVTETIDGTSAAIGVYRRKKVAGDTTFTLSWTNSARALIVILEWAGVDGTTPDQQAASAVHSSTANWVTPSATPTTATTWAVACAVSRTSTSGNKAQTFTADAALTERYDANNSGAASSPWSAIEVADSNGAVTQAAHSYTEVGAFAETHGGTAILFLNPAASGTQFTSTLTGASSGTGAIVNQTSKPLTGSSTGTGADIKQTSKTLTGSSTGTGAVSTIRAFLMTLAGSVTGAGAIVKQTLKTLTGSSTGTGAAVKAISKTLTGSSTGTGAAIKSAIKTLAGTITAAGSITTSLVQTVSHLGPPVYARIRTKVVANVATLARARQATKRTASQITKATGRSRTQT